MRNSIHKGLNTCWIELEQSRGKQCWLPWRPDFDAGEDEGDCEDVDRIVSVEDLEDCLYPLSTVQGRLMHSLYKVGCCFPSETFGRKGSDSNLRSLTELPVLPQAVVVVETLICCAYILFWCYAHYGIFFRL